MRAAHALASPRIVRVTGAAMISPSYSMTALRVRSSTGRRLSGGRNVYQRISPRFICELVPALAVPHRAALVVDDDRDVLVVPAVAQLVDTEETQVVERVAGTKPRHHALDDAADRRPPDAHHVAERRLVGSLREVGDVLLEVVG
jgi:hypothetical protein